MSHCGLNKRISKSRKSLVETEYHQYAEAQVCLALSRLPPTRSAAGEEAEEEEGGNKHSDTGGGEGRCPSKIQGMATLPSINPRAAVGACLGDSQITIDHTLSLWLTQVKGEKKRKIKSVDEEVKI